MSGGSVLLFRHIVLDDRRLFIRFRTSGGSAYVWEGKRPVNERVSATHLGNERISATHLKRRGQTAVSFQNEGEESIAEGSYKRMVSPGPRISEM